MSKSRFRTNMLVCAMLAPGLIAFLLLFAWPLVNTIWLSLQGPDGLSFVHYAGFFQDPQTVNALVLAGVLALSCTGFAFLLSLPLSLIARTSGRALKLLQPLVLLPLIMPPIISAFGLLIFWKNNGWFNLFLIDVLGLSKAIKVNYTLPGLILFYVWLYLPYTLLNAISSVRAIDPAIENAARVGGAREWTVFRRITLPLMLPGLLTGSVLTFVMAFGAFTIPLIAGGDIRPLAVHIYTVATVFNKWDSASAMAVIMAVIQIVFLGLFLNRTDQRRRGAA